MSKQVSEETQSSTLKGIRIQTFSLWIVIGTILVSILIGDGIINVMNHHKELAGRTHEYIRLQDDVMDMSVGSDYLTEQARLFVMAKDRKYAEAYFHEVEVLQRRDKALYDIEQNWPGEDSEFLQLSKEALQLSNALMDLEIHAMKLAALSVKQNVQGFPARMQEYLLPKEELQCYGAEQSNVAEELVFGADYQNIKRQIEEKLSHVAKSVTDICATEQADSEKSMQAALIRQSIYTILVVLLVIFSYVMIAVLILRPIRMYVNCIENNHYLDITGAYEFKYFAATYNNVYEMSMAQQSRLRQQAERDALTGLLNRQAFEQLKAQLNGASKPLALLLIDVDVFKAINDNYGHETGDLALIRVAKLLEESFRTGDDIFRIGGDEFAVVMGKVCLEQRRIISEKVDRINDILQHPKEDFPKYSLSVGVAFSNHGYHDDLFRQADQALYHTKENGRCGYTFYESKDAEDIAPLP